MNKTNMLVQLSKGNRTTPADERMQGLQSQFAQKVSFSNKILNGSEKEYKPSSESCSESSESESSDDDEFLGLEQCDEEPEIEYLCVANEFQVKSSSVLVLKRMNSGVQEDSPKMEQVQSR